MDLPKSIICYIFEAVLPYTAIYVANAYWESMPLCMLCKNLDFLRNANTNTKIKMSKTSWLSRATAKIILTKDQTGPRHEICQDRRGRWSCKIPASCVNKTRTESIFCIFCVEAYCVISRTPCVTFF